MNVLRLWVLKVLSCVCMVFRVEWLRVVWLVNVNFFVDVIGGFGDEVGVF